MVLRPFALCSLGPAMHGVQAPSKRQASSREAQQAQSLLSFTTQRGMVSGADTKHQLSPRAERIIPRQRADDASADISVHLFE